MTGFSLGVVLVTAVASAAVAFAAAMAWAMCARRRPEDDETVAARLAGHPEIAKKHKDGKPVRLASVEGTGSQYVNIGYRFKCDDVVTAEMKLTKAKSGKHSTLLMLTSLTT